MPNRIDNQSPVNRIFWGALSLFFCSIFFLLALYELNPKSNSSNIPGYSYPLQPKLSGWRDDRLKRLPHEPDLEFAKRMNKVVSESFYHCEYSAIIDFSEFVAKKFIENISEVGFLAPDRPCGYCHQSVFILANVLDSEGIEATPMGLSGHVVVIAKIAGKELVFDPDLGTGPFEYRDQMWGSIASFYPQSLLQSPKWASDFQSAFYSKEDDSPYYSLEFLRYLEKNQRTVKVIIKSVLVTLGILLLGVFLFIRKRS